MEILEYIKPELLVLIPVMYLIGVAVKHSVVNNRYIPLVLGIISVLLCILWVLASSEMGSAKDITAALFTAVTQGVLIAGASVYADQLYKQSKKDKKDKGEK